MTNRDTQGIAMLVSELLQHLKKRPEHCAAWPVKVLTRTSGASLEAADAFQAASVIDVEPEEKKRELSLVTDRWDHCRPGRAAMTTGDLIARLETLSEKSSSYRLFTRSEMANPTATVRTLETPLAIVAFNESAQITGLFEWYEGIDELLKK